MADDLPSDFDVIVLGTGMPESILAAALSRVGQRVLHIDRNEYYSGQWASFSLEGINKWMKQVSGDNELQHPPIEETSLLQPGEALTKLSLSEKDRTYFNVESQYHIGDEEEEKEATAASDVPGVNKEDTTDKCSHVDEKGDNEDKSDDVTSTSEETTTTTLDDCIERSPCTKESSQAGGDKSDRTSHSETDTKEKDEEVATEKKEVKLEPKKEMSWTATRLKKEWRRFNLDIAPRLLYCAGNMVELLISSDIAKYCEFRTVTRILTFLNDKLEKVPCSRADVFSSKDVSMLEKRMLMKLLSFCADYDNHWEDYQDFAEKPFDKFLKSKKLTKNICHYVQHSIAMATNSMTTSEGLARTKKFLHSLGRYGNTAFLWPLYGSGELPQSFCRMCAVFGGVYCLRMAVSAVISGEGNRCNGVVLTNGQRINCRYLIMESSYANTEDIRYTTKRFVNRGIFITDKSVVPTDEQQLSLMFVPDAQVGDRPTSVLELPPSSMTCPQGLHVVHMTRPGRGEVHPRDDLTTLPRDDLSTHPRGDLSTHPRDDLSATMERLFNPSGQKDGDKPNILWSMYFSQTYYEDLQTGETTPDNIILLPGPGPEVDLNDVVTKSREIFDTIMPGEEFLPRPPNPEDIIYVDESEATVGESKNQSDFTEEDGNETSDVSDQSGNKTDNETSQSGEDILKEDTDVTQSEDSKEIKGDKEIDQSDGAKIMKEDTDVTQSEDSKET